MRLLDTTTLQLKEFFDPPEYAILSHRWEGGEVSFEEYSLVLQDARYDDEQRATQPWLAERAEQAQEIRLRTGYSKIRHFCRIARDMGLNWAWIDTCCIDKRSSAELSEAINSM